LNFVVKVPTPHLLKAFLDLDFEVENTSFHAEEADGNTLHPSDPFYLKRP